ncbi:hypothetical protein FRC08_016321 [Ceratobasidium sp. 394]|nr:hypothetical protein FRC08_016321 [Ceratobasidium sp. 394]
MIISRPPSCCHKLVRKLQIKWNQLDGVPHNVKIVGLMLGALENLQDLDVTPTTPLGPLYIGLKCPFQLKRLVCARQPDKHFVAFLNSQPSIVHLELGQPKNNMATSIGLVNQCRNLESKDAFLPCLASIAGDPPVVSALCPGRPITQVKVTNLLVESEALAHSIAMSTVVVRAINLEIYSQLSWQTVISRFLSHLKSTPVASTLQELKFYFLMCDARSPPCISQLRWVSDWVDGFSILENLVLDCDMAEQQRLSALSYLAGLIPQRIGRKINPSLKQIKTQGVKFPIGHSGSIV